MFPIVDDDEGLQCLFLQSLWLSKSEWNFKILTSGLKTSCWILKRFKSYCKVK